ncbi:hypothetical protein Tco_0738240, partial [Tanacetum coccineum]
GKENGLQILQSIDQGPFELGTTRNTLRTTLKGGVLLGLERPRTYDDLSDTEKKRYDADVYATNIVLQGLPKDIYKLISHNIEAKAIWDNVKMLLAGSRERESEDQTDSMAGANLRTITAPPRFVISLNSSHHSGANIVEAEVNSFARPSIPLMTVATAVTSTVDPATTFKEKIVGSSVFGGDSSGGRADHTIGGFSDLIGSDFIVGGIRTVISPNTNLQKVYVPQWSVTNDSRLDDGRTYRKMVGAASQMSLSAEVRMRAEYNIRERRRLNSVEAEAAEAIPLRAKASKFEAIEKSLQIEVRVLKDYNTTREKEKSELDVKVVDLVALVKVREQEAADLDAMVTSIKSQNDNLVDQVHELETYSVGLQEKVTAYENCMGKLEEFQDEQIRVMNDKFEKLYVDFVEMEVHLEEKFYPHLLTTIAGRRWLLTYGVKLAIVKCLHSPEYLSALRAAISMAIEKGIDYIFALQELQDVNFSLLAELKSNKDVSTGTLMNILHLDEPLAERLGLDESQPHVDQLLVVRKYCKVLLADNKESDYISALQELQDVNFSLLAELKSNKDASTETLMNILHLDEPLDERLGLDESQPHVDQLLVPIHHSPDRSVIGANSLLFSLDVSRNQVQKIGDNIANHRSALRDAFVSLIKPLSSVALEGMEGTFSTAPETITALSVTFASTSFIPPISTNDYDVHADGQEGIGADGHASAGADVNPFPDIKDAELDFS